MKLKKEKLYFTLLYAIILTMSKEVKAVEKTPITVNNYNRYCEDGVVKNVVISFNENVAKYNKYGHYKVGDSYMPTGNPNDPFSNVGDRELARDAVDSDITYKIHGEIDYEEVDYSYEDYEDLTASEIGRYEIKAKIEALKVGNEIQEKIGYGKYNLRNGKNLAAFLKFAYGFYSNSGEYRVGKETAEDLKGTVVEGLNICPMEEMKIFKEINSASVELGITFNNNFKECTNNWQYVGNKEIYNSDRVFEKLQDIYVGLVYLYPALKELQGKGNMNLDELDDNDRGAIFSMVYEIKGQMPISPNGVTIDNLVKKFSRIGMGDMIGALIEDGLDFSVAERIYRYMIEIKYKNNDLKLARWISEYEDIMERDYEPLNEEDYKKFLKAYNEAYAKYGSDISKETAFDYINYGQVENPEHFESKISLKKAINNLALHLETYFKDSQFMKGNKNYVAKSYMMAKKICENESFIELTDIYASDVKVIEYSKGYVSDEVLLSDTQIVKLDFPPNAEDDYDTDADGINDTIELGVLELVDISKYIEAYIEYNRIKGSEAEELRKNTLIPMYNYISNPVLPDSDFDGRDDLRDRGRALENDYTFDMDTLNNEKIHFDFNMDYRYFFMDSSIYYPELSDMSLALSNMIGEHKGKRDKKFTNRNPKEIYSGTGIKNYLWYIGQEDIEERNTGVVPYAISHREIVLRNEKGNRKLRNIITIVIGEDEKYKGYLSANIDGTYNTDGNYEEYHHVGFDIEANKIMEEIEEYINNQYGTKVFWITGFGSGGSIANLIGQKLSKKKGVSNVYTYTFESFATINANNIKEPNSFDYRRYENIFNLENEDNFIIKILDRDIGWYKYGRSVKGSAAQSRAKLTKILGNNFKGSSGKKTYKGSPNIAKKVINSMINIFKEIEKNAIKTINEIVSGFTDTGPNKYYESEGPGVPANPVIDEKININSQDEMELRENEHMKIAAEGVQSSSVNIEANAIIPILDSNMLEVGQMTNNDKNLNVEEQSAIPNNVGEGRNKNDARSFEDAYLMGQISTKNINYDYQKSKIDTEKWSIKIGDFKYSNYTIPYEYDGINTYDISYSQFWYKENKEIEEDLQNLFETYEINEDDPHYALYKNNAGDFSDKKTNMIFGRYHKNNIERKKIVNDNKDREYNFYKEDVENYECDIVTIDGRLLIAAPLHLLLKTNEDVIEKLYREQMNKIDNYDGTDFTNLGIVDKISSENKKYKYVDIVVESSNDYQYVIPCMVVDVKWLHNNASKHYSIKTDNTYGHVYENINAGQFVYEKMNPIEPYVLLKTNGEENNKEGKDLNNRIMSEINVDLQEYLFGKFGETGKIISMRLYDKSYETIEKKPNEKEEEFEKRKNENKWWTKIKENIECMSEEKYMQYKEDRKQCKHGGIIVDYKNEKGGIDE